MEEAVAEDFVILLRPARPHRYSTLALLSLLVHLCGGHLKQYLYRSHLRNRTLHRGLETVPDRYIRDGDDRPAGDHVCALAHIPVIDVGELPRDDELNKLRLACQEWGFFQVINSLCLVKKITR